MVRVAAVKAMKKAEMMKERMQATTDLLADNETWMLQQQLQRLYQRVLIMDLEYALDKKVEQDLWNFGFKNVIANFQTIAKDKKHAKRTEGQAMLHWFLESASGSYLNFLQEICAVFELDLPFRRCGTVFGCTTKVPMVGKDCQPSKRSCYYICQHCLVHLGDIARYRNQNRQAETYYRYAVMLSPASGQPYNQLAILEASRGDKLSTVYHYVRAVALAHPFPVAATNLSRAFDKHADYEVKFDGHSKLSSYEYIATFLKLHGLLHTHTGLEAAEKLVQMLTTSLTAHIATESLSSWKLVQIVTINIYTLERFIEGEFTELELKVKHIISQFFAGCLNAFLLPVYTIKAKESLLEFFAMPAIKMTLDWIRLHPEVLSTAAFQQRLQIWPSLCRLLNEIQPVIEDFHPEKYKHVPLPEDRDLQGFLPLEKAFLTLKFKTEDLKNDVRSLSKLRAFRVVDFGSWLAARGENLFVSASNPGKNGIIAFEPVGRPEPPGDLLRELEKLTLDKLMSPTPSDANGSATGSSTPDSVGFLNNCLENSQENGPEKRPGILKNDATIGQIESGKTTTVTNRGARNVALTSILNQKVADDVKQVTFRTPSPVSKDKNHQNFILNKKTLNNKQNKPSDCLTNDLKSAQLKEKVVSEIKVDGEEEHFDQTLVQQQKLMNVLAKSNPLPDQKQKFNSKIETTKSAMKSKKAEQKQEKQQLLSALFDASKVNQQPQAMSGLLNLNKQQQEILANSKHNSSRRTSVPTHHKVVDKIEAARKDYEEAMVLQQQKQKPELQQRRHESEHLRFPGEPICETSGYERILPPPPPPVQQAPMFLTMNPPMMAVQQLPFKYRPEVMIPWQEPEQLPMPPQAWWSDRPHHPPMMFQVQEAREPAAHPQLSTYSLFSNPINTETEQNYHMSGRLVNPQSFWSGPGPSPLERLLEQQRKQMRDAPPNT